MRVRLGDMRARSAVSHQFHRIRRTLDFYWREGALTNYVPRGHFYSPLPDCSEGAKIASKIFERPVDLNFPGLDLRVDAQKDLLFKIIDLYPDFSWSEQPLPGRRFHFNQDWYKQADSICLYSVLRIFRPRSVIEVGSGYSSALMLDVDERYLGRQTAFTFIEPESERLDALLSEEDKQRVQIIRQPVQNCSVEIFSNLKSGDILFIDSSHVAKVGSDVNYLMSEIIPRVPVGMLIHFHDVFWPFEYPPGWVQGGIAWNEAYLLRAFLMFNSSFEIVLWVPFCAKRWPNLVRERMPGYMSNTGAAIWVRRVR